MVDRYLGCDRRGAGCGVGDQCGAGIEPFGLCARDACAALQVGAALLAGDISYAMFQTIVYRTNLITDTDALAAVDAELAAKVRRWASLTRGRLAAYVDMKVKVTQPVQVVWDGTRYTKGDTPDVPDDVGRQWIRQGWATETKAAAPRKRSDDSRCDLASNATSPQAFVLLRCGNLAAMARPRR